MKTVSAPGRSIERFDGTDYPVWAVHMRDILHERHLSKYLNVKTNIEDYQEEEDLQTLAEIRFTLSNNQVRLILQCKTANEAWEKLKTKYQHSSKANRVFLKSQFLSLKMKNNERMTDFIQRIDDMADQLTALGDDISNEDKSIVLTRGVSTSYRTTVIAIQEAEKLDNYEHVTNSLINEETHQNETKDNNDVTGENAFYSNQRSKFNQGRGQGNRGNYHTQGREGATTRFEGNCHFCGIYGHKESECRRKQNQRNNMYHRGYYQGNYNNQGNHQNQANRTEQQEEQTLNVQLFTATAMIAKNKDEWLLDSGASHHMTARHDIFTTYEKFDIPTKIELGNDSAIYAEGKGTIRMNLFNQATTGILTDVLYVPEVSKNLFSVGKAIERGLSLEINQDTATFYNKNRPVMTASKRGNLYYINGKAESQYCTNYAYTAIKSEETQQLTNTDTRQEGQLQETITAKEEHHQEMYNEAIESPKSQNLEIAKIFYDDSSHAYRTSTNLFSRTNDHFMTNSAKTIGRQPQCHSKSENRYAHRHSNHNSRNSHSFEQFLKLRMEGTSSYLKAIKNHTHANNQRRIGHSN